MDLQEPGLLERDYQTTDNLWKYILLCAYICYARNEETQGEKTSRGSVFTILYLPSHPISKDRSTDNPRCKHLPLLLHNIPLWSKIWDAVTHQSVIIPLILKDTDKECFARQLSCLCKNQGTLLNK